MAFRGKGICPECSREHGRGKGLCPGCYAKKYRETPEGKKNVRKSASKWAKTHPAARERIVRRYREHTGYYCPADLLALRRANKRLEEALASAENRAGTGEPGERSGDDVLEWRD